MVSFPTGYEIGFFLKKSKLASKGYKLVFLFSLQSYWPKKYTSSPKCQTKFLIQRNEHFETRLMIFFIAAIFSRVISEYPRDTSLLHSSKKFDVIKNLDRQPLYYTALKNLM